MAQSLNTKVEIAIPATSFMTLASYGNMMIGDKAVEFYNERNVEDYIQIPWAEIDHVAASVMFKGKMIPRFAVFTKRNGTYSFSTRDNKAVLRIIRDHIGNERVVRSATFLGVVRAGLSGLWRRITHRA